jgi:hypothetical protein
VFLVMICFRLARKGTALAVPPGQPQMWALAPEVRVFGDDWRE